MIDRLRTGIRVTNGPGGDAGEIISVTRTRSGRTVVEIDWDDVAVAVAHAGYVFITRPYLAHHLDADSLVILTD